MCHVCPWRKKVGTSGLQMMGQSRAPNRKQYNIITSGFSSSRKRKQVFFYSFYFLSLLARK